VFGGSWISGPDQPMGRLPVAFGTAAIEVRMYWRCPVAYAMGRPQRKAGSHLQWEDDAMARHDDFDLTRLERMERRLQALEDAEAIRNLKSRYAALCDDNYDADGIAALFAEDATWESPGLGWFEGREAIRAFFRSAAGIFSFAIHYSLNGQIYVDGDLARAQWYLFMPCTVVDGNRAMWRASIDHERYRRVDGSWLFSEKRSQPLMNVPFKEGWELRRFM
jgi:uncharacterized protein (TIGR02246 family)